MNRGHWNLRGLRDSSDNFMALNNPDFLGNRFVSGVSEVHDPPVFTETVMDGVPNQRINRKTLARSGTSDSVVQTGRNEKLVEGAVVIVGVFTIGPSAIVAFVRPDYCFFPLYLRHWPSLLSLMTRDNSSIASWRAVSSSGTILARSVSDSGFSPCPSQMERRVR